MIRKRILNPCIGQKGTQTEEYLLQSAGFERVEDVQGDVYYVGPFGHIVWLSPHNEWYSDKAPQWSTYLDAYLRWIRHWIEQGKAAKAGN